MADKQYSVYYLLDPRTNQVRYVGYSCRPSARFRFHLKDKRKSHKVSWIAKLKADGITPVLSIRCLVQTHDEACRVETELIAYLRARGVSLTNETSGGSGTQDLSLEASAKRSASLLRYWDDAGVRKSRGLSISAGKRGIPISDKHRAALVSAWASEESRANRSKPHSEEWKKNIKDGWAKRTATGIPRAPRNPWTAERRAKVDATWAAKRNTAVVIGTMA